MRSSTELRKEHPALVAGLLRAKAKGRLAHSFLLVGAERAIREDFALFISRLFGCRSPREDGMPCDGCPVCRLLGEGKYGELYRLSPVGKGYEIRVGEVDEPNSVRYLIEQLSFTSFLTGGIKIALVEEADRMNAESQNAFLKTLEEPPANCVIIMHSGNGRSLLPTTSSRCQIIAIPGGGCDLDFPGSDRLVAVLTAMVGSGDGDFAAAEKFTGAILELTSHLEEIATEETRRGWEKRMAEAETQEASFRKKVKEQFDKHAAGEYMRIREHFLSLIHTFCAHYFLASSGAAPSDMPHPEYLAALGNIPMDEAVVKRAERFSRSADRLLEELKSNVNEELAFRVFCHQALDA